MMMDRIRASNVILSSRDIKNDRNIRNVEQQGDNIINKTNEMASTARSNIGENIKTNGRKITSEPAKALGDFENGVNQDLNKMYEEKLGRSAGVEDRSGAEGDIKQEPSKYDYYNYKRYETTASLAKDTADIKNKGKEMASTVSLQSSIGQYGNNTGKGLQAAISSHYDIDKTNDRASVPKGNTGRNDKATAENKTTTAAAIKKGAKGNEKYTPLPGLHDDNDRGDVKDARNRQEKYSAAPAHNNDDNKMYKAVLPRITNSDGSNTKRKPAYPGNSNVNSNRSTRDHSNSRVYGNIQPSRDRGRSQDRTEHESLQQQSYQQNSKNRYNDRVDDKTNEKSSTSRAGGSDNGGTSKIKQTADDDDEKGDNSQKHGAIKKKEDARTVSKVRKSVFEDDSDEGDDDTLKAREIRNGNTKEDENRRKRQQKNNETKFDYGTASSRYYEDMNSSHSKDYNSSTATPRRDTRVTEKKEHLPRESDEETSDDQARRNAKRRNAERSVLSDEEDNGQAKQQKLRNGLGHGDGRSERGRNLSRDGYGKESGQRQSDHVHEHDGEASDHEEGSDDDSVDDNNTVTHERRRPSVAADSGDGDNTEDDGYRSDREMLDQSSAELKATIDELERRYDTIENEGNEWKTRYETQTEMNQQLEKQILLLQEKVEEAKRNLKEAGKSPRGDRAFDDLADASPQMVKSLEREKNSLCSQLRDLEWRLDQESKAYHKANDERKQYVLEINATKVNVAEFRSRQRQTLLNAQEAPPRITARSNLSDSPRTYRDNGGNIPEDQRILDPRYGPIRRTAGIRALPSLDSV